MNDRAEAAVAGGFATDGGQEAFEALRRAIDAEDWAGANVAVRTGWFVLAAGGSETTRELLERVPASVLRTQPLLAMELGIAYNKIRYRRVRALRYFVTAIRAARSVRQPDLHPVDRVLIRTAESGAFRLLGRTGSSIAAARAALEHVDALSDEERAELSDLPRIYAQLGVSLFHGGLPGEALEAAARGLAEAPTTAPSNGMSALALLAGMHALAGDIPQAREYIEYARSEPWTDLQRNSYHGVYYRVAEAVVALERFDSASARAQLGSLLAMTTNRHAIEQWTTLAQVEALAELVDDNPGAGLAGLEEFVALRGGEGRSARARADLGRVRAVLQLALGNPDASAAIVKRDLPAGPTASIERARVALALGQTGTALNELRAIAGEHLSNRQAAEAAALEAAVLLRISPTPRRDGIVDRLGSLLARSEQRLALALLPPRDLARVAAALDAAGYVHVTADIPSRPLLRDVEPDLLLSKRELAVLEHLMQGGSFSEIAAALVVSTNTVKTQIRSIYKKLGVSGREDAVAVALERHLLVERD